MILSYFKIIIRSLLKEKTFSLINIAGLAIGLSCFTADQWLNSFAYRVDIEWTTFVLAGVISLIIAFVPISFRSVRAALTNPIDSLQVE